MGGCSLGDDVAGDVGRFSDLKMGMLRTNGSQGVSRCCLTFKVIGLAWLYAQGLVDRRVSLLHVEETQRAHVTPRYLLLDGGQNIPSESRYVYGCHTRRPSVSVPTVATIVPLSPL